MDGLSDWHLDKRYDVFGFPVTVAFEAGLVRIRNDRFLRQSVDRHPERSVDALVRSVKADYAANAGRELAIGDDSFVVEIWGHLYADHFLVKYRRVLRIVFPFGLYGRFRRSCAVIDCGERGKDPNRRLWDYLARYRGLMARWATRIVLCPDGTPQA